MLAISYEKWDKEIKRNEPSDTETKTMTTQNIESITITITDVISSSGEAIHGGQIEDTVQSWNDAGYTDLDSDKVAAWCEAKCFDACTARDLQTAGVSPEDASDEIERCGYSDTIACIASNGDISTLEAVVLTRADLDDQIKSLRDEAVIHGDTEQVEVCDRAIGGDADAVRNCISVMVDALAMQDADDDDLDARELA
jgi:hypothetical protein